MKRKLQFDFHATNKMQRKSCELCHQIASVYCAADAAFLCSSCDASVHGANFLVARHVRLCRCITCGSLLFVSGPESDPPTRRCSSCRSSPAQAPSCSSSHSDARSCLSTAESNKKMRRGEKPTRGSKVTKTKQGRIARHRHHHHRREEEGWAESD